MLTWWSPYRLVNYQRYGSLVLVGRGISVTAIISIIKDIYEKGEAKQPKKSSHCMKNVHVIWIMPFEANATLFLDQLLIFCELSTHETSLPLLEASINVTCKEPMHKNKSRPIFYSRPDLLQMMNECTAKAVQASSSLILIFACDPERYVAFDAYFNFPIWVLLLCPPNYLFLVLNTAW